MRNAAFIMRQVRAAYESGEPAAAVSLLDELEELILNDEAAIPGSAARALREINHVRDKLKEMQ